MRHFQRFAFGCSGQKCPFGRMASALVSLAPTPFCQRDTDQLAEPRAVDLRSSHQFEEEIGAASSENRLFIAKM